MLKCRKPLTFYEALEPLRGQWWRFIWWLMDVLIQPVRLLTSLTAWLVDHMRLLLVLAVASLLFVALADVQPLWAAAALVGVCLGILIATLIILSRRARERVRR
jgi:membrane protein YdbS with pleckstrin-like domain